MVQLRKMFSLADSLDVEEAKKFLASRPEGSYTLLDVRQPAEYEEEHLPGAKLIPLGQLGEAADVLDKTKPVITYCAIGGRSRVAAQLLQGYGFQEVYNLKGGIKAWQGYKASGPEELHLELIRGDETPAEIAALAIGMEESLKQFYETVLASATDGEVKALCSKMVEVSELHKQKFLDFYRELEPGQEVADLEARVQTDIMEGGYRLEEFLEKNRPHLQTLMGALDIAMMLETQALDLYRRFGDKVELPATRDFLLQVAQEEKLHLQMLGELLEAKVKAGAA
ncbi:MAG: rhodanese-like domain-containing protein [Desulfobacca sp.]|uniref:rhodanese-like domain-containing protein n=1 Tax=Desulfobacca sp. TaxID=2067990 RepID=UPI004049231F